MGGGIWFEPYAISKDKKRVCFYVFRNKSNELVLDNNFESESYNYLNQGWYKQIKSQITKEHNTAWSLPYYENQGSETMMITVGTGIYDGDNLIGISTVDWEISSIYKELSQMKPFVNNFLFFKRKKKIKGGFTLFADKARDFIIASDDPFLKNIPLVGGSLKLIPWYNDNLKNVTYIKYHNKIYVPFVKNIKNGTMLILCVPKTEMYKDINAFIIYMFIILSIFCFLIPVFLYLALNLNIVKPIEKLIEIAKKISNGMDDIQIKIEKPQEFAQLASVYDKMTTDIKSITKEREKINSELSIAKTIQESSLPDVFPPFPNISEFDIFASMVPAREVGGDFFDFYFIDDDNFMFLIADVSGKGVPSALFMMTAKTLIKDVSQMGYAPNELIKTINKRICENNKQKLFVTVLSGIVNIKTGKLYLINCGHNIPLIKHKDGQYEFIKLQANIPLGAFDNFDFKIYETQLYKDDILFMYTDGVTEAINEKDEMFGENRLLECLNKYSNTVEVDNLISDVKTELKNFVNSTPQSDDITMLCFKYNSSSKNSEKTFTAEALIENYNPFLNWLHETIKAWNLSKELINKIEVCSEEIFVNVASYAYPDKKGVINVSIDKKENEIILKFEDFGFEYNPLLRNNPDITLSFEERPIGGLGIFLVKEMTKNVEYERKEGKNILTLIFNIS